MAEYIFDREFGDAIHSSPSSYNVDHHGEAACIACLIEAAVPGESFRTECDGEVMRVITEEDWDAGQQAALATAITDQKALDDWPPE